MNIRKYLKFVYLGIRLVKFHKSSYIAYLVSTILWIIIVVCPALVLSPNPIKTLYTYFPGILTFNIVSSGVWTSVDYFRFYYYQGLTDLFIECGVGILEYSIICILTDGLLIPLISFITIFSIATMYVKISIMYIVPKSLTMFIIGLICSLPLFLLGSTLTGIILVLSPVEVAWISLFEFIFLIGTVIPPQFTSGTLSFIIPTTLAADLLRAAYSSNYLPIDLLYLLSPIYFITISTISILMGKYCDKVVKRRGIPIRRG